MFMKIICLSTFKKLYFLKASRRRNLRFLPTRIWKGGRLYYTISQKHKISHQCTFDAPKTFAAAAFPNAKLDDCQRRKFLMWLWAFFPAGWMTSFFFCQSSRKKKIHTMLKVQFCSKNKFWQNLYKSKSP